MSDTKSVAADSTRRASCSVLVEVVAGTGQDAYADGPLDSCAFRSPYLLCQFQGSLLMTDYIGATVREVSGVLGSGPEVEAALMAALLTAVPVLPKELARLVTLYARAASGVRTIARKPDGEGCADGPALRGARFRCPTGIAVDTSDPWPVLS